MKNALLVTERRNSCTFGKPEVEVSHLDRVFRSVSLTAELLKNG
jgi:hypothetical protein